MWQEAVFVAGVSTIAAAIGLNTVAGARQLSGKHKFFYVLSVVLVVIGICNFLSFAVAQHAIGGTAAFVKDGHFYVNSHGKYTEVTESVFNYSRWHGWTLSITHPLLMAAAGVLIMIRSMREPPPQG